MIDLKAQSLELNGVIRANGLQGYRSGGAGGSVHIEVASLSGAGGVYSNGGNATYGSSNTYGGAGGRISVYVEDDSGFSGAYQAAGHYGWSTYNPAGAGTVYIKRSGEAYGHLTLDNLGRNAQANSTRLRTVGLQTITALEEVGANLWKVTVSGTPWQPTNAALDIGLQGVLVDLDASSTAGPFYTVLENGSNWLLITTSGQRSPGSLPIQPGSTQLGGMHIFASLQVLNGAKLFAANDVLIDALTLDSDGDGVPELEDAFPDNPAAAYDTDGDGLADSWLPSYTACQPTAQFCNGLELDMDDDNDGIPDVDDAFPLNAAAAVDSDGDGLPDAWLPSYTACQAADLTCNGLIRDLDNDNDGLSDEDELALGTDPFNPDSDGDGYPDGIEHLSGMDPLNADSGRSRRWLLAGTGSTPATRFDLTPFAAAYYLTYADALTGGVLRADSLNSVFSAVAGLETLAGSGSLLADHDALYISHTSGTYRLDTQGEWQHRERSLSATGHSLSVVDGQLVQGDNSTAPSNRWDIIPPDRLTDGGYAITDLLQPYRPAQQGLGQQAVRFNDWVYFTGSNGGEDVYPAFYGALDADIADGVSLQRIHTLDILLGRFSAQAFSTGVAATAERLVMTVSHSGAYAWTRNNSHWQVQHLPQGVTFADGARMVTFTGNAYALVFDNNLQRFAIYQLEKDQTQFRPYYYLPVAGDVAASELTALQLRLIDSTWLAVVSRVTDENDQAQALLLAVDLNVAGLRAPVIVASHANPVGPTDQFRLQVQFDVSMDAADEPLVSIDAPQGQAPYIAAGGYWISTVHMRDTYVTPSILLDSSHTGPLKVSVSGGTDIYGNPLAQADNLYTVHVQSAMPVITAPALAPAVTRTAAQAVTVDGYRTEQAILINGNEVVEQGSGAFAAAVSLPEGHSQWLVTGRDQWGYDTPAQTVQWLADFTAPVVNSSVPAHQALLNTALDSITLNVTETGTGLDQSASQLLLQRDGVPVSASVQFTADSVSVTPVVPMTDGHYTLAITLVDQVGNRTEHQISYRLDYTPPVAPVVNSWPAETTINQMTLSGSKEAGSALLLNDTVVISANAQTSWQYTVSLNEGDNSFSLRQRDAAGNTGAATVVAIRYDNTPPGLVLLSGQSAGDGQRVLLGWAAYDEVANGNDIAVYRVYMSAQLFLDVTEAGVTEAGSTVAGVKQFMVDGLPRGETRYFAVVAEDRQQQRLTQVIALAVPVSDIQAPADIQDLQIRVAAQHVDLDWRAVADTAQDLAGYRIYLNGGAAPVAEIAQAGVAGQSRIAYRLDGLAAATQYALRISSYDSSGNTSPGVQRSVVTWLANPVIVSATAGSSKVTLNLTAVAPYSLLQHYAVYRSSEPFTDVTGMAVSQTIGKGSAELGSVNGVVTGLQNGQTYYLAVVAVNTSGGFNPQVVPVAVTPMADQEGPQVMDIRYLSAGENQNLAMPQTLTRDGVLRLQLQDETAIGSVQIALNGTVLGQASRIASGHYEYALALQPLQDGAHILSVVAQDTLLNERITDYPVTIDLSAPAAPVLTEPATAQTVNTPLIRVAGQAARGTEIMVRRGTVDAGQVLAGADGRFALMVEAQEGANVYTAVARYSGRADWSVASAVVTVTLDSSIPDAPAGLTAHSLPLGQINLQWQVSAVVAGNSPVAGYHVYRALEPFSTREHAGAVRVNNTLISARQYRDMPAVDGRYYYGVTSVNAAGTESALSVVADAVSDNTPPFAVQVSYEATGRVDRDTGAIGPGRVDVTVQFNEVLRNTPFFAITPDGGLPMTLELVKSYEDDTVYHGSVVLEADTVTGVAYAVLSAHDQVGNKGTRVEQGQQILLDTKGPHLVSLALNPASPVRVDEHTGTLVEVFITLDEDMADGLMPQLIPQIHGEPLAAYAQGISLVRVVQPQGQVLWTGSFMLDTTAGVDDTGLPVVDTLSFAYRGEDAMGNVSTRILADNAYQVYQGELPPLAIPAGLTALAKPDGEVELGWDAVEGAVAYQLYRRAPHENGLTAYQEIRSFRVFTDQTTGDGEYEYAIASVREGNGQQSLSAYSTPVRVYADATAPLPPQALTLTLSGAGIVARWQAPALGGQDAAGNELHYALYRLNLPEQATVTLADLEGVTPLHSPVQALTVLDSHPSTLAHSYTVVAVDKAGNVSAPAAPAYLNAGLLPVTDLQVHRTEAGLPEISWKHGSSSVQRFTVYRIDAEGQAVRLNDAPILRDPAGNRFTDIHYRAGDTVQQRYGVIAHDNQQAESLMHSIVLPALSARLLDAESAVLLRGTMNRLSFRVQNTGDLAADGVTLYVTVMVNGQPKAHQSAVFAVEAGGFTDVDVVIGGYDKLDAISLLALRLEQQPNPAERVRIEQQSSVSVRDGVLPVSLQTQTFTRGGSGWASFSITNTSDVTTELLMARNSGKVASHELRLRLEDEQGNVLSEAPVHQFSGGVVTTTNGLSVARVAPGETFTSQPVQIAVPAVTAETVILSLVVDAFRYDTGRATEVVIRGNGSRQPVQLTEAPYKAMLEPVEPAPVFGRAVLLQGRATLPDGSTPVAHVPVKLLLESRGFQRVIMVQTDTGGAFSHAYLPQAGESGEYQVAAVHPDVLSAAYTQRFVVQSASVTPARQDIRIPRNHVQTLTLAINTGRATPLEQVRLQPVTHSGEPALLPTGITLDSSPLARVAENSTARLTVRFSGDNHAPATGNLRYRVVAGSEAAPQVLGDWQLQYTLTVAAPSISTTPAYLNTGLSRGETLTEYLQLHNTGFAPLEQVQLSMTDAQGQPVSWATLASPAQLAQVAVGEKIAVAVQLAPGAGVAEGQHALRLLIRSANAPDYRYPVQVAVTQSGVGQAFFHISDIYTATLDDAMQPIPGLKGAKIELQNELVLSQRYTLHSDDEGEALFHALPAGRYSYRVSAFDHDSKAGQIWIRPGTVQAESVFLQNTLVSVEWIVNEITIDDRYEIVLEATYATQVPVAVLKLTPGFTNLPDMKKGDVFRGEMMLANLGLIRADNIRARYPADNAYMDFDFQYAIPQTLEAGAVFYLPYKITALKDFRGEVDANATGGSGPCNTQAAVAVNYTSECANGQDFNGAASAGFGATTGICGTGGGSGGGGGGIIVIGGGGSSGGGINYSPVSTPLNTGDGDELVCAPECPDGECER